MTPTIEQSFVRQFEHVILNRAAQPCWWGRSVAEVCLKPWQFSCWLESDPNRVRLLAVDGRDHSYATALSISVDALAGILPDYTFGATHYHALHCMPSWATGRTPCVVIGQHAFYNDID